MTVAPRIDGIVASQAPVAIIFRRGPSKSTQLLTWNLETDEVTPGQWIRGRVYTRRCDLSPDGQHLVGCFTNYSTNRQHATQLTKSEWSVCGWTAVSKPPYFTAIALWFTGGAWNGGGIWRSETRLDVNDFAHHWVEGIAPPRELKVRKLRLGPSEDEPLFSMLLEKRGWVCEQKLKSKIVNRNWKKAAKECLRVLKGGFAGMSASQMEGVVALLGQAIPQYETLQNGVWSKPLLSGGSLKRQDRGSTEQWSICNAAGVPVRLFDMPTHGCQFLDTDHRGRVVFGDEGKLWAWDGFPSGSPTLVADLTSNRFNNVAPPAWALHW